ncbi:matrix metalloproteinase-14-like [Pseudomyrmex gracilis]|uniref:matrix metalloproteinase-14-like n=1 Tax=Pseudomyrmex gracilis TaxID=219809 RepID=UPI00099594A7|nr:matrix metalloproteinase-14-like [Pseudomyrmex gracilis]
MWDKRHSNSVCPFDCDGRGGIFAHAYYSNGDLEHVSEVHIDNAEQWHVQLTENPWNKNHVLHTLTHEIGHAIGIEHSPHNDLVMYVFVPIKQWPVTLSLDDVLTVQNHYGPSDRSLLEERYMKPRRIWKPVDLTLKQTASLMRQYQGWLRG